jgi:thiosulfate/3-mercaptopyruvate sulfurtransferase
MYPLLITAAQLQTLQQQGTALAVVDCSFDLMKPELADGLFEAEHIAGALHAHLDRDLSTHADDAVNGGRHPLPAREKVAAWLGSQGIGNDTQVVVYDRQAGNYCGRLWWMLKWLGHEAVAVLDGGLQGWKAAGGAVASGPAQATGTAVNFAVQTPLRQLVMIDSVVEQLGRPAQTLVDARGAPRYRGEVEPLDPIAGHIPGALNRPFTDNFTPEGFFKSADVLKAEWDKVLSGRSASTVVHHCGSGVSAVPNLIAMELAGYGPTALYAGSWSEWSRTTGLPYAKG